MDSNRPCVSVVIATADRPSTLRRTLAAIATQTVRPAEVVVVDAGANAVALNGSAPDITYLHIKADHPSAARQRNLGVDASRGDIVWFLDDDAYPEPACLKRILEVFKADVDGRIGGVGALLSNQHSMPPSPRARRWFDYLAGEKRQTYGGALIGPAVAILPEATADEQVVSVEWLNTTCTAYRRSAFLGERFSERFSGYSFMEDVDLSARVAKRWKLLVHTGAKAYHDSQPSAFKRPYAKARMAIENQHYVMTATLERRSAQHHWRFLVNACVARLVAWRSVRSFREAIEQFKSSAGAVIGLIHLAWRGDWRRHSGNRATRTTY